MGPWGIAAILALAAVTTETGRTYLKKALRGGIRAGYYAKDAADEFIAQATSITNEVKAEIKDEQEQDRVQAASSSGKRKAKSTSAAATDKSD